MSRDSQAYWLGDAEGQPPHWGGRPRRVEMLLALRLATGKECWRVRIKPALPAMYGVDALSEAVISTRYTTDHLADLAEGSVPVRVSRVLNEPIEGQFSEGDLSIDFHGDLASTEEALPTEFDNVAFLATSIKRIQRYIEKHSHSRMPIDYDDEDGRLGILVNNIRWHAAGKAGTSPGPFPGVDYQTPLNNLEGWSWDLRDSLPREKDDAT